MRPNERNGPANRRDQQELKSHRLAFGTNNRQLGIEFSTYIAYATRFANENSIIRNNAGLSEAVSCCQPSHRRGGFVPPAFPEEPGTRALDGKESSSRRKRERERERERSSLSFHRVWLFGPRPEFRHSGDRFSRLLFSFSFSFSFAN